jgi:FtsZ-binding cell division protein ZapB
VTELQARLDAMAQEMDQLRAQVSRIDDLRAENLRLTQQGEVLLLEQERLRSMLARIGELGQRASEARPGVAGETAPDLGS